MRNRKILPAILLTILIICSSWGFFSHKTINQLAIYALPQPLQSFFYANKDYIVDQAVRPDLRRNDDEAEAPRHFIDIDVYGKEAVKTFPRQYADAVAMVTEDTLVKYGILPWHIVEIHSRLTEAFRQGNKDSILFYAADLGHYIADAHVPLHTALNYDGQLTGQKGIHSLWETKVPELFFDEYQLKFPKAKYIADPLDKAWDIIEDSHKELKWLFEAEKIASIEQSEDEKYVFVERYGETRRYYSDEFAKRYGVLVNKVVNDRLVKAGQSVADYWFTAWVNAGMPDLDKVYSLSPEARKEMKAEIKAWKKENLLKEEYIKIKE